MSSRRSGLASRDGKIRAVGATAAAALLITGFIAHETWLAVVAVLVVIVTLTFAKRS